MRAFAHTLRNFPQKIFRVTILSPQVCDQNAARWLRLFHFLPARNAVRNSRVYYADINQ